MSSTAGDISLFWEWLGVLTGLVVLFALAVFRIQWQDPPEPQTWIDRLLDDHHSSASDTSPTSSDYREH